MKEVMRNEAAVVIQNAFKIPSARRVLERARECRRQSDEMHLLNMTQMEAYNAAAAIQCCWKGYSTRKKGSHASLVYKQIHKADIETDAATCIQATWRWFVSSRFTKEYRDQHDMMRRVMADTIVKFFRTHVATRKVQETVEAKQRALTERKFKYRTIIRTEAASLLQAWWRGTLVRNKKLRPPR
eukprot:TRINITY_DN42583_c0_g1_i1.p1 TRINITY_DN42583_c0_g1~~TRINITY_DN42583_c0_g1_i1.p1  ORF type:complete len:193 (+),score=48.57 TRINITY_DN42583_c0_g1_i1:27-581(+)